MSGSAALLGFRTLAWEADRLVLLDQTALPATECSLRIGTLEALLDAIRRLAVRGAPALGCAAAYGMLLGLEQETSPAAWLNRIEANAEALLASRPTAVNLSVGVEKVRNRGRELAVAGQGRPAAWRRELLKVARTFHAEDAALCQAIGQHGAELLPDGARVLTHCNAGALATGGIGTALGVLYLAHARGGLGRVYADETRPLLQGARLTAWELQRAGIEVTLLCDGAAGSLLASGAVDAVLVGADRIAANGDFANKIGTYPLAVLAQRHALPFYVAAPRTTVDPGCPDGAAIPIEERPAAEILYCAGQACAPPGTLVHNPAFDRTPAELVSALVTETGVLRQPDKEGIAALLQGTPAARAG